MTNQQKYNTILAALAEAIQHKDKQIVCLKWQVENLEAKLKEAEASKN